MYYKKRFSSELLYNGKYLKTKKNCIKVKSTQIFMIMECEKKVVILFFYQ